VKKGSGRRESNQGRLGETIREKKNGWTRKNSTTVEHLCGSDSRKRKGLAKREMEGENPGPALVIKKDRCDRGKKMRKDGKKCGPCLVTSGCWGRWKTCGKRVHKKETTGKNCRGGGKPEN